MAMLVRDQVKSVAQEIGRTADHHVHEAEGRVDVQQLWEVARRAARVIEVVAELEGQTDLDVSDRERRTRFIMDELESALEFARRARIVLEWRDHGPEDAANRDG
jgi:hypothetical protein